MLITLFSQHNIHIVIKRLPQSQRQNGEALDPATNKKMEDLFDSLDVDDSGFIDPEEIIKLTEKLGEKMTIEVTLNIKCIMYNV